MPLLWPLAAAADVDAAAAEAVAAAAAAAAEATAAVAAAEISLKDHKNKTPKVFQITTKIDKALFSLKILH